MRASPPQKKVEPGYFKPHKSFIKRCSLPSHGPFLLSILLITSLRQELSIFAKRFSQSLTVHRQQLPAEGMRGSAGGNEMPKALPPVRAADGAAHGLPGDPRPQNFISSSQTSSRGESWVPDVLNHLYCGS